MTFKSMKVLRWIPGGYSPQANQNSKRQQHVLKGNRKKKAFLPFQP